MLVVFFDGCFHTLTPKAILSHCTISHCILYPPSDCTMPKFSGSRERLSNVAVAPSNDTASVSSVSTAASSPISTPPSSPFRDDSGVVVEDFERGTLHFKENLGKRESTSMIPSVPTDNDPIQAIRAALALPDHFDLGQLSRYSRCTSCFQCG
jgi:hypothetical protein